MLLHYIRIGPNS